MELVTGRAGTPHITSQQIRQQNQGIFGADGYILNTGSKLETTIQSANEIRISDGALMFQGALFAVKVGTYDPVTIQNGTQGMQRKDLIVARYTFDQETNIESGEWVVIEGTPAESNPEVPTATSGNIQEGDSTVDCPVFVVNLDGINVTGVDVILDYAPSIQDLQSELDELSTNLGNKFDKANIFTVSGYLTNTSTNTAFNLGKTYSTPPYLLAAQIQLTNGVWSDLRTLDGITRIDNNTNQVNVIKETAATYANYLVRFVFLAA